MRCTQFWGRWLRYRTKMSESPTRSNLSGLLLLKNERKSSEVNFDHVAIPPDLATIQFWRVQIIAPIAPHLITLSSELIFENAGFHQIRGKLRSPNLTGKKSLMNCPQIWGMLKIKYSPKPGSKITIPQMDTPLERDLLSGLWDTFYPSIDPLAAFLPFTEIY